MRTDWWEMLHGRSSAAAVAAIVLLMVIVFVPQGAREQGRAAATILDDTTAPTSTAVPTGTLGLEGWYLSPVVVEVDGSDGTNGSGVSDIMYRLDGGEWAAVAGVSVTVSLEGSHLFEYYAVDAEGNEEEPNSLEVKIDTEAPVTKATVKGSVVNLTATDNSSGVWITLYRIDGGSWSSYASLVTVSGAGNHTVQFYSADVAGNNETVRSVKVHVEEQEPLEVLGLPWYLWAVIAGAAVAVTAVAVRFTRSRSRRRARASEEKSADEEEVDHEAVLLEDEAVSPESLDDELDRLAELLDRK